MEITAFIQLVFTAHINKKMVFVSGGLGGVRRRSRYRLLQSFAVLKERKKEMVRMRELEKKPSLQSVAACQSVALLRQVPVLSALSSPIRPLV